MLVKLHAVVDELEAQRGSVGQGEEVGRSFHPLLLLLGEGGQPGPQPGPHAGGVVSIREERPGEPAQDVVQGALALLQAFQTRPAGLDPVGGQSHGDLALLPGAIVAVVDMPCSCMSLKKDFENMKLKDFKKYYFQLRYIKSQNFKK